MFTKAEHLYLDLMKKALSFLLWPEPPVPIETDNRSRPAHKRLLVSCASNLVRIAKLQLVRHRKFGENARYDGKMWPGYAHTMIGMKRLDNLQSAIETVIQESVEGDLIETGVWRGGACIFMRAVLAAYGIENRRVFVADSFEGLPKPDDRHPADKGDRHHTHPFLAVSREEVEDNFRKYGLLDEKVVFLKGWFKETLPAAPIEKLAVLRLDGDMYGSTLDALLSLYPKLSRGGFCIIDDYGAVQGCRQAVDEYRTQQNIRSKMCEIDWTGRFWRKE